MALKGKLKDFSITQLLNLVNLAKKSGTLEITNSGDKAIITFLDGKLVFAELSSQKSDIGTILFINKIISTAQFNTLKKRASNKSDKELGLLLINAGYVSFQEIISSLQKYTIRLIQLLYSWAEGNFNFVSGEDIPSGKIPVKINLENIILESSRRLRELENLEDEMPNLDLALRFSDRPGINLKKLNLSSGEWRVISFINSKNSVKKIAKNTKMSDIEIRRIVYGLLQAGLVELVRLETNLKTFPQLDQALPGKTKEEQKNLVQKLISRIKSS